MEPTAAKVWLQLSQENGVVSMVTSLTIHAPTLTGASFSYTSKFEGQPF
jgi:hypothetical protein